MKDWRTEAAPACLVAVAFQMMAVRLVAGYCGLRSDLVVAEGGTESLATAEERKSQRSECQMNLDVAAEVSAGMVMAVLAEDLVGV